MSSAVGSRWITLCSLAFHSPLLPPERMGGEKVCNGIGGGESRRCSIMPLCLFVEEMRPGFWERWLLGWRNKGSANKALFAQHRL